MAEGLRFEELEESAVAGAGEGCEGGFVCKFWFFFLLGLASAGGHFARYWFGGAFRMVGVGVFGMVVW